MESAETGDENCAACFIVCLLFVNNMILMQNAVFCEESLERFLSYTLISNKMLSVFGTSQTAYSIP